MSCIELRTMADADSTRAKLASTPQRMPDLAEFEHRTLRLHTPLPATPSSLTYYRERFVGFHMPETNVLPILRLLLDDFSRQW